MPDPGPVRPISAGPGTPGTAPRRVAETPTGNHPAGAPAPCDAPHQTPRADPTRSTGQDLAVMPPHRLRGSLTIGAPGRRLRAAVLYIPLDLTPAARVRTSRPSGPRAKLAAGRFGGQGGRRRRHPLGPVRSILSDQPGASGAGGTSPAPRAEGEHRKAPGRPQGGFLWAFRQRGEVPCRAFRARQRSAGQVLGSFVWIRPDQGAGSGAVDRKAEE